MRQKVIDYLENPDKKIWADLTSEERRYIERVKGVVPKAAAKPAAKSSGKN